MRHAAYLKVKSMCQKMRLGYLFLSALRVLTVSVSTGPS
jgi:hypothetical protein